MPTPLRPLAFTFRLGRATALLLVLAAAFAVLLLSGERPAQAQGTTAETLVSNIGDTNENIPFATNKKYAQLVYAGNNPWGYKVTAIDVYSRDSDGDSFTLQVCQTTRSGSGILIPDENMCTALTDPSSFAMGTLTFNAPTAGITMSHDRFYALVFLAGSDSVRMGGSKTKAETGKPGWRIGNTFKEKSGSTWSNHTDWDSGNTESERGLGRHHLRVAVKGTVNPPPTIAANAPLVSNIGNASENIVVASDHAQAFVVGDSFFNFTVTSIDVYYASALMVPIHLAMKVCAADGAGNPDTSDCTNFTAPPDFIFGQLAFTAPAGFTLSPNTTYFVVLSSPSGDNVSVGGTLNRAESGRIRWEIKNKYQYLVNGEWLWPAAQHSIRIAVKGEPKEPGSTDPRVLVSNVRRVDSGFFWRTGRPSNDVIGQRFTTGSDGGAYRITAAELGLLPSPEPNGFVYTVGPYPTLTLRTGGENGTLVATFDPPPSRSLVRSGSYMFTLSSPVTLLADTHYWLTATGGGVKWSLTYDSREDPSTLAGWSYHFYSLFGGNLRFRIIGEPVGGQTNNNQVVENSPAQGIPGINGILEVGQSLLADTAPISDVDGLENADLNYQWLADDVEITEARGADYTLTSDNLGKVIRVKVDFTDDNGNEESLISEPTPAVTAATNPELQSAAVDRDILTLTFDTELDTTVALPPGIFGVNVNDASRPVIAVAVGQSNVILLLDTAVSAGDTVTVDYTVPTDDAAARLQDTAGNAAESFSGQVATNNMQVLDQPEDTAPDFSKFREALRNNSTATGEPAITGTAEVGETLTADTSGISDADGMTSAGFSYQWLADDDDISGAEGSSYVLPDEDEGREIKVRVSFTDDAGNAETVTSAATATVAATSVGGQETPLTASAHNAPSSHDGNTVFTFGLRFSETPREGFSYKTLHDNAFTVTGGEVVQARRLEKGRNVRWEISVRPGGDGPVTIVLPATTDCEADGAVCTGDGRKLSPGLEFEVPGLSTPEISLSTPEITSGSSFSVDEGATQVATLRATDGDTPAANLTWSISGGDDEAKFAVTAAGALSFAAAKDYETPDDAGADGVYEVTVQVSDGGRTDSADLTVALTNVNEAPTADAGSDQADVEQGAAVTLSGSGTDPDAGEVFSFAWVQTSGATVTLSDTAAALPTFTAPTGQTSAAELIFTLRVTDDEGLFAEDSVTVAISGQLPLTPLTASAHSVPASHDGNTAFTFELRFSEEFAISYKTLRDHAFTATGGEVVKVRRLEKGKNVRWEISVTPDGNGPVTIVLPATTDCEADGAVCTDDGRMLSTRLEITVPGP